MKTKMNNEELKTLQEITGLLTEEQKERLHVLTEEYTASLSEKAAVLEGNYVGKYVSMTVFNRPLVGLVDQVHVCPNDVYLGVIGSRGDEWVSTLASPAEVKVLVDEPDIRAARMSALRYIKLELESLENDPTLAARVSYLKGWECKLR